MSTSSWCRGVIRTAKAAGCLLLASVILGLGLASAAPASLRRASNRRIPPKRCSARGTSSKPPELAEKQESAASLAFAARALLMHAGYIARGDQAVAELRQGEALARRAVAKDPDMVEGLLELVIALGYHSRQEGYLQAHSDGYGKEARRLIEKAMALAPDMGWARAAYGGWNAEIVARGGAFLGKLVYGATRQTAIQSFEKAIALDPDNATIRVEYAKALIRMEPKHPDLDKIRAQLHAALAKPPGNAVDRIIQGQGRELLDAVDSEKPSDLETVVDRLTPFEK